MKIGAHAEEKLSLEAMGRFVEAGESIRFEAGPGRTAETGRDW